jgi:hypothetical protein
MFHKPFASHSSPPFVHASIHIVSSIWNNPSILSLPIPAVSYPIPEVSSLPDTSPLFSPSSSQNPISPPSMSDTNTHPMTTRAKDGIVYPRLHPTLLLYHAEPKTEKQAMDKG